MFCEEGGAGEAVEDVADYNLVVIVGVYQVKFCVVFLEGLDVEVHLEFNLVEGKVADSVKIVFIKAQLNKAFV